MIGERDWNFEWHGITFQIRDYRAKWNVGEVVRIEADNEQGFGDFGWFDFQTDQWECGSRANRSATNEFVQKYPGLAEELCGMYQRWRKLTAFK